MVTRMGECAHVDEEILVPLTLPLDADGFLRRECPNCEREFKVFPSGDSEPVPADGYCCPYCGERAGNDSWFTRGQIRVIDSAINQNVIPSLLGDLEDSLADLERTSGGLLSARIERSESLRPSRLTEPNDMKVVAFDCHPKEPIKVVDEWSGPVHCIVCGETRDL
jgi:hypothetical protein